ncbi:MAG: phytanoyl-CoA dioxygenase family protein [Boseongicola sp.]
MHSSRPWGSVFDDQGFAILRGVVQADAIEAARTQADAIERAWRNGEALSENGELRVLERDAPGSTRLLDGLQGLFKHFGPFQELRSHQKITGLLKSRLGSDLVSVVDTLFLKPPKQPGTGIAFHRDAQFRKPPESFRDLAATYVQVGFPLEPHGPENGGLVFVTGSHKDLTLDATQKKSVRGIDDLEGTLNVEGRKLTTLEASPGDIVLWHPYTIHGSPPNHSETNSRKFYVVGYMSAYACDVGEEVILP